jgi:hypothetical protein
MYTFVHIYRHVCVLLFFVLLRTWICRLQKSAVWGNWIIDTFVITMDKSTVFHKIHASQFSTLCTVGSLNSSMFPALFSHTQSVGEDVTVNNI